MPYIRTQGEYFTNGYGRVYFDLRDSKGYTGKLENLRHNDSEIALKVNLKVALTRKMRLRIWGYSQGEHLYLVTKQGLTMKYKMYSMAKRKGIAS